MLFRQLEYFVAPAFLSAVKGLALEDFFAEPLPVEPLAR